MEAHPRTEQSRIAPSPLMALQPRCPAATAPLLFVGLHVRSQMRFLKDKIYTYISEILVAVNPFKSSPAARGDVAPLAAPSSVALSPV